MRLDILDRGYPTSAKLLFAFVRLVSGHPMPDAARLVFYRPGFYGTRAKEFTHATMRGPSPWTVAERELMAAYVATVDGSAFCVGAHTAAARLAYRDDALVRAVLDDLDSAPVGDTLRATLRMLGTLTRDGTVTTDDMRAVLAARVPPAGRSRTRSRSAPRSP